MIYLKLMKLLQFLLILSLFSFKLYAQKEAANWYFGVRAGLHFEGNGNPSPIQGHLATVEGSASISDRNGNSLFYTDGMTVYDRRGEIMLNGTGLKGNVSSTQSAIIVPRPANPGRYFIFTIDKPDYSDEKDDPIEGVNFSEIDMSLNNGYGAIIPDKKNIHLITYNTNDPVESEFKSSEKITAVVSGDCVSYWVLTQFTNKFYAFNVSSSGVNTEPVVSTLSRNFPPIIDGNDVNITAKGYLKFSPNGEKIAAAYSGTSLGSPRTGTKNTGQVYLYDFDDITGKVSNDELILNNKYPYGVEFSPKTTKLYITSNTYNSDDVVQSGELYQFDLNSSNILSSRTTINSSNNVTGALQLALNGKIYRAGYPALTGAENHTSLSVINNPEELGSACNYSSNSVNISPSFVRLGLPPFIQSLFNNPFDYEDACFDEATSFIIKDTDYDSVEWDFGDGVTSVEENPSHVFEQPGTYTVVLTKFNNGIPSEPICKEIEIVKIPDLTQDFVLRQCDIDESSDGLTTFNLLLARDYLTAGQNSLQVYFYEQLQDALDDENNEASLDNIYTNKEPDQILYAKVVGGGTSCYDITEIKLKTTESISINPSPVKECDFGDGKGNFNFVSIEAKIKQELNLDAAINLTFHTNEDDAAFGENPLPAEYTSEPRTIYIRAEDENICYGFGKVDLELKSFPNFVNAVEKNVCAADFPIEIGDIISINAASNYQLNWNTGENTPTIVIDSIGKYTLTISDPELDCAAIIDFNIQSTTAPIISDVNQDFDGKSTTLTIHVNNTISQTLYALDYINGTYQESPVFTNVPFGEHIVYAKDTNGCDVSEYDLTVFGIPQYFTPNNDGYHDLWLPYTYDDPEYEIDRIFIYDRFGKLLIQLDPEGEGWDGTYRGKLMPTDDYWFQVSLKDGRDFKGHFTLKR